MKNIFNFARVALLFIIISISSEMVFAQPCHMPTVPVFSTVLDPDYNSLISLWRSTQSSVQASNGEHVFIGLGNDAMPYQHTPLYFYKMDATGNLLGNLKRIQIETGPPNTMFTVFDLGNFPNHEELMDVIEVFDVNGNSDGFVAIISPQIQLGQGSYRHLMAMLKLDNAGNVVWHKSFPSTGTGHARKLIQYQPGGNIIALVDTDKSINGRYAKIITADLSGTNFQSYDFPFAPTSAAWYIATDMISVNGIGGNAKYAIAGTYFASQFAKGQASILYVDGNFNALAPMVVYDVNGPGTANQVTVSSLKRIGNDLVVCGNVESENGFVFRITPKSHSDFPSIVSWYNKYVINDPQVAGNYFAPALRDIVVMPNGNLTVSSNLLTSSAGNAHLAGLVGLDENSGAVMWARGYNDPFGTATYSGGQFADLNVGTDGGLIAVGYRTNGNFTNGPSRDWVLKTDSKGKLSECNCWRPHPVDTLMGFLNATLDFNISSTIPQMSVQSGIHVESSVVVDNEYCDQYNPSTPPTAGEWKKIYGDKSDNIPKKIKAFKDGVFVASVRNTATQEHAVFSKFDINTGAKMWELALAEQTFINDFDYDPACNGLFIVGETRPRFANGAFNNNASFVMKIDCATGAITDQKVFEQTGRESLTRIVRHPFPKDPVNNLYILGTKNPSSFFPIPGALDQAILINMDCNLDVNRVCDFDYNLSVGSDDEFHRGIVATPNGNILLLGNDVPANDGILVEVDGSSCNVVTANRYDLSLDFYDGVYLPNGNLAIAGEFFGQHQGFIAILDPTTFALQYATTFEKLIQFKDLGIDNQGRMYVTGQGKGNPAPYITVRITDDPPNKSLWWDVAKFFRDNETVFNEGHISVTPALNNIFYVDDRDRNESGVVSQDMLIGKFDLDFNCRCTRDTLLDPTPLIFADFPITVTSNTVVEPKPLLDLTTVQRNLTCTDFCIPPACDFDFRWTGTDCYQVDFIGIVNIGTAPYTWAWDIGCDGTIENSTQGFLWQFPDATPVDVCLYVTDVTGCMDTIRHTVILPDDTTPPKLTCPPSMTIDTDLGKCFATFNPTATDDCDTNPTISCNATGATVLNNVSPPPLQLNKGTTTVTCVATDDSGNASPPCTSMITVEDNEAPTIICPTFSPIYYAPYCDGGLNISFPDPIVDDNCPDTTWVCSHVSGHFFECGQTLVTCTATDASGNESTCSTTVNVECQCARIDRSAIKCDQDPNTDNYIFEIVVENLSAGNCTYVVSLLAGQGTIVGTPTQFLIPGTNETVINGTVMTTLPISTPLNFSVQSTCTCPNGDMTSCILPVNLTPICCEFVETPPRDFCSTWDTLNIVASPSPNLNTAGVSKVKWFVQPAPCPTTHWGGIPYQETSTFEPLFLNPSYYSGDICVYVEIDFTDPDRPCNMVRSEIQTIRRCEPVSCFIISGPTESCNDGVTPFSPGPMKLGISNPGCAPYVYDWYDYNGNLVATATDVYTPTDIILPPGFTGCYMDFSYKVEFQTTCGLSSCSITFRLYNENAPVGSIVMDPLKPQPFCPGEDATLKYTPECAEPNEWTWEVSNFGTSGSYSPMPNAGTTNPVINTNQLYSDTWYKVIRTNGVCPADEVVFPINVKNQMKILSFTAISLDACRETGVQIDLNVAPCLNTSALCDCNYKVTWYKDGQPIHVDASVTSLPISYTYIDASLNGDYSGNYYAVVEDNCCPGTIRKSDVAPIDPPMILIVTGPCFRCYPDDFLLESMIFNPVAGVCTYQWYKDGIAISGATSSTYTGTMSPAFYELEVTCGGCTKREGINMIHCGPPTVSVNEILELAKFKVFPNPTAGSLNLEWQNPTSKPAELEIVNSIGQRVLVERLEQGTKNFEAQVYDFASGNYFIRLRIGMQVYQTIQFVKK